MKRREFITLLGGAVAVSPLAAGAQQARVYTLGVLTLPNPEPLLKALREGLRDAGYVEGGNLRLEIRSAAGKPDLQLDKAAELVRLKVDLIVTFFTPSALAAKQATQDIPIVMAGAGDPVATGLIASLARPGGNVTGQSSGGAEVAGKSSRADPRTHSRRASCGRARRRERSLRQGVRGADKPIRPQRRHGGGAHHNPARPTAGADLRDPDRQTPRRAPHPGKHRA